MTDDSKFLVEIVKEAEKIANEDFIVKTKGGESDLVTNLDVKIEEFLIGKIKQTYPSFAIVSEEENYDKVVSDNCFIIDPIDGTINFANNLPLWGIQIAMKRKGKTVAAVIDLPRIGEFYYADETGAYLNDKKIMVKEVPIKNTLYAVDGGNNLEAIKRMAKYSFNKRTLGAFCVSMAFVAAGRIHGAVFRSDKPWDYEPGLFIIEKAGGKTMNISGFHAGAMNEEFLTILKLETQRITSKPNVFVLHSLNGDTLRTWGVDVRQFLAEKEIDCHLPEFPIRAESSFEKFDKILSSYLDKGILNENSIIIAHSIANPYFIRFCREHKFTPIHYIAIAPKPIYNYPSTRTDYIVKVRAQAYLKDIDFAYAKNFKDIVCFYSDEDDGVECFLRFIKDFGAKPMYLKGYNHFDGYHRIYKIPELIQLIDDLIE